MVAFFRSFEDFVNNKFTPLLKGLYATDIYEDNLGNLWITSIDQGVFFLKRTSISNIPGSSITDIVKYNDTYLIIKDKHQFVETDSELNELYKYKLSRLSQYSSYDITKISIDTFRSRIFLSGFISKEVDMEHKTFKKSYPKSNSFLSGSSLGYYFIDDGSTLKWGNNSLFYFKSDTSDIKSLIPIKELPIVVYDAIQISQNNYACLLYTSPSPRDRTRPRMPSSA